MPFSPTAADRPMARSSVRTISVVNSFVSSGAHRSPEMEGKGRFGVGGAVKAEIFLEGGPDRRRYLIPAHNAGTGKSLRQSLFPRGQHRQSLPKHGFSIWRTVWRTPAGFFSIHSCRES